MFPRYEFFFFYFFFTFDLCISFLVLFYLYTLLFCNYLCLIS
jgi:hypothetical protein